ncbi:LLM class F420-dependent oxidoreductase [Nocardioides sp. Kera G14]|uniref:LLM class F420-dependent oxidoreductase n=1 Tax=Nocardioides sp. Kera G14 TaxID=2884264 RepID=UPI001D11158E|nr:LLM class F420-dependent oxidoreductase [Nocardioides sp. Kera G14]UDY22253.1 LLM class F420-dependent oxidoreductase [Nocardioides sp. Kera G14]
MRNGIVLFTSDRGIRPAELAKAAEERGFDTFYVPEHTHIPVKREALHPTGGEELPDDRYLRTLDPWVVLGGCAAVTSRIGLSTAVALPVESDPITLAKTIASLDFLSGGRVSLGVGFGWNTDELADHHVPADRRRTVLKEYLEAMRSIWTEEEASYDGEFVSFGPSWAYPKPTGSIPVVVGAELGPQTARWIARHADGWMSTPRSSGVGEKIKQLQVEWEAAGRDGKPEVRILVAKRPTPEDLAEWSVADELIWGVPDAEPDVVLPYLDKLAGRLGLA